MFALIIIKIQVNNSFPLPNLSDKAPMENEHKICPKLMNKLTDTAAVVDANLLANIGKSASEKWASSKIKANNIAFQKSLLREYKYSFYYIRSTQ